jgi:hypothetical protein
MEWVRRLRLFGMWVYNDELQNKFTFRSGPMIFGRVMALGLWNLAKYLASFSGGDIKRCSNIYFIFFYILVVWTTCTQGK